MISSIIIIFIFWCFGENQISPSLVKIYKFSRDNMHYPVLLFEEKFVPAAGIVSL